MKCVFFFRLLSQQNKNTYLSKLNLKALFYTILFFLVCIHSNASIDTLFITDNAGDYPAIDVIEICVDTNAVENISTIQNKEFHKLEKKTISYGLGIKFVWARFVIVNKSDQEQTLILNVNNPDLNQVEFYDYRNGDLYNHYLTGELNPNRQPNSYFRTYYYELIIPSDSICAIYIKIGNSNDAIIAPITLTSQQRFVNEDYFNSITHAFIYGILSFVIIIAIILFVKIRQLVYLYAIFYLLFGLFLIATIFGYTSQILFSNSPELVNQSRIILIYFTAISGLTFGYEFLKIRSSRKNAKGLVIFFDVLGTILALLSLFPEKIADFSYILWPFYVFIYLGVIAYWSTIVFKHNKLPAIIIVLSFVPISVSVVLLFLRNYGYYQSTTVLIGFQYVLPLQMIIVAYGLVEDLRQNQNKLVENLTDKNRIIEKQTTTLYQKNKELEQLNIASSNTDNGIAIFDENGNIMWYNKFFGVSYSCIMDDITSGKRSKISEIIPNKEINEYLDRCKNTKQSVVFETIKQCRRSSLEVEFQITLTPILNDNEEIVSFVSVETDISKIKEAGREKEILQHKIAQMEKLESIGKLAGGIAHDFNNLLTPIIGYADMVLMEDNLSSNCREDVEAISMSAQRAKKLVNQILIFSNYFKPVITTVSIEKIIIEVQKILSKVNSEITLNYIPSSNELFVDADETHIHQVIMNICKNGMQAIGDRSGAIAISTQIVNSLPPTASIPLKENDNYIRISISDTGKGMEEETINRIFDPFFTTKHISEGTGLGMSVVHGIVQQYNGTIQIESEVNKGTTVNIFFPLSQKVSQINDEYIPVMEKKVIGKESQILLIDDEEEITKLYIRLLTSRGWQVVAFNNSIKALEYYKSDPTKWDIVITDQTMPSMQGDELARNILKINPSQKIVLMTGYSEYINREQALNLGITEFVLKPVSSAELLKICTGILE